MCASDVCVRADGHIDVGSISVGGRGEFGVGGRRPMRYVVVMLARVGVLAGGGMGGARDVRVCVGFDVGVLGRGRVCAGVCESGGIGREGGGAVHRAKVGIARGGMMVLGRVAWYVSGRGGVVGGDVSGCGQWCNFVAGVEGEGAHRAEVYIRVLGWVRGCPDAGLEWRAGRALSV
eukprot:1411685-Pleurochrysis_carterae.AAC.1